MRATGHAHLNRLELRFLIKLGEEYNACSSVFLDSSMRATGHAHLNRLELRFLIKLGEEYKACNSAL